MIASLAGVLTEKSVSECIVDVNGVGYRVALSAIASARLPERGSKVSLRIRTVVREDALDLYGFLSAQEEELFLHLTSISHVGPKLALNVLSGLEVDELVRSIAAGDVARLTKIHGVGRKTAERVVLELKEKMKLLQGGAKATPGKKAPVGGVRGDVTSALVNLGYKEPQAAAAVEQALDKLGGEPEFEPWFREALKALRS
ncbi:MAG: Holliday junction branch migration protein RuvA [Myxococcaceae bacterium]|nr:Holliday junction branch migration protein RuvA [Myxococcaceae bacterium]